MVGCLERAAKGVAASGKRRLDAGLSGEFPHRRPPLGGHRKG